MLHTYSDFSDSWHMHVIPYAITSYVIFYSMTFYDIMTVSCNLRGVRECLTIMIMLLAHKEALKKCVAFCHNVMLRDLR
jgi:hypothetical protein